MSIGQTGLGAALIVGAIQLGVVPLLPSPPPIEVHSLVYEGGLMLQDRTVRTENDLFPASWRAAIYNAETDKPIEECVGSGFWNYTAGRNTFPIPVDEWVGRDECTVDFLRALNVDVYGVASWHWGDDHTPTFKTEAFTP